MNESADSRARVDRAARRNYVILCTGAVVACVAIVVGYIAMFSE